MAKIFLSYKMEDQATAQRLQRELETLGHTIRLDTNTVVVGSEWRDSLMRALMDSDAVVVLVTERSIQSPFVVSEIGAARAFGQTSKKDGTTSHSIWDNVHPSRNSRLVCHSRSKPH